MVEADTVDLNPVEFALLLGVGREESPILAAGTVRLDRADYDELRSRRGSIELSFAFISKHWGYKSDTLYLWRKKGLLACRNAGGRLGFRVAPTEWVRRLRQLNAERDCHPVAVETAGQRSRRAQKADGRLAKRFGLSSS